MKKKSSPFASLESILERALKINDKPGILHFARILSNWEKITGPQLYKVSRPDSLSRKTLTIGATEPVWVDSMMYMKNEIIRKVNSLFAEPVIKNIKIIHNSDIVFNDMEEADNIKEAENIQMSAELDPEYEEALELIEDCQLRSIFRRVMLKDRSLKSRLKKTGDQ